MCGYYRHPVSAINLQEKCKQISEPNSLDFGFHVPRKPHGETPRVSSEESTVVEPSRTPTRRGITGGCASWSLPVDDGAYQGVLAWRSRSAWMSWVVEELATPRGVELCRGKIKADTLLMVAREDAATADSSSGRGVSTSRATVAKRLGMSGRHVGTARGILEQLGAAVTIERGRHLSPQERSLARAAHGGYQEAAGSVRALTMPALTSTTPTEPPVESEGISDPTPVDTFHLPRRGSVNKTPPVKKYLPTRAKAREKAATRPKLKRKTHSTALRAPRDIETQRFVWAIAQRFLLSDASSPRQGAPLRPGVLRGGRHIGHLARILERNNVTPRRYTPQSLADALQRLIEAGKFRSPRHEELRDPLAHFAWTLRRLNELTEGETTIERIHREDLERADRRRKIDMQELPSAEEQAAGQAAAQAFFASARRLRRPAVRKQRTDVVELVTTILGRDMRLYDAPPAIQELVGDLTTLHKTLIGAGWALAISESALTWTYDGKQPIDVTLDHALPHRILRVRSSLPAGTPVADAVAIIEHHNTTRDA